MQLETKLQSKYIRGITKYQIIIIVKYKIVVLRDLYCGRYIYIYIYIGIHVLLFYIILSGTKNCGPYNTLFSNNENSVLFI